MKDKHPIDDLFRENLASHRTPPPPGAWDAIESNLNNKAGKRRPIYLFSAIAASVCIILASTITFLTHDDNTAIERSNGIIYPVEKGILLKADNTPGPSFKTNLPQQSISANTGIAVQQVQVSKMADEVIIVEEPKYSVGIYSMKKSIIVSNSQVADLNIKDPIFELPTYSINLDQERTGFKSRFFKGVVSMAKGVQSGQKTISGLRKSKIEFVSEDLNYNSKKESESEATIDEDSPSKQ